MCLSVSLFASLSLGITHAALTLRCFFFSFRSGCCRHVRHFNEWVVVIFSLSFDPTERENMTPEEQRIVSSIHRRQSEYPNDQKVRIFFSKECAQSTPEILSRAHQHACSPFGERVHYCRCCSARCASELSLCQDESAGSCCISAHMRFPLLTSLNLHHFRSRYCCCCYCCCFLDGQNGDIQAV